jgi:hypothetical protein
MYDPSEFASQQELALLTAQGAVQMQMGIHASG